MKRLLLILLSAVTCLQVAAQDVILRRDAEQIEAIVKEVTDTEVKYKKYTNPDGATYVMKRAEVFSITYANGYKDNFAAEKPLADPSKYPYPKVSKSYQAGELFNEGGVEGIVIYTTDNGRHGLILSLEESTSAAWAALGNEDAGYQTFITECTDFNDGWNNLQKITDIVDQTGLTWANFPAFSWCREQGPGWYLPAKRELEHVYDFGSVSPAIKMGDHTEAIRNLNTHLLNVGGMELRRMQLYWSSTEAGEKIAYVLLYQNTRFSKGYNKVYALRVRAVHKF